MMKPIVDYVLVEKDKIDKAGELLLAANKNVMTGTVLAVGPGVQGSDGWKMQTKVNDKVVFLKNAGQEYKYEGKDCILLSEEMRHILAIL